MNNISKSNFLGSCILFLIRKTTTKVYNNNIKPSNNRIRELFEITKKRFETLQKKIK